MGASLKHTCIYTPFQADVSNVGIHVKNVTLKKKNTRGNLILPE